MNQCCNVINNLTWHLSMLKQRKIFIQWNERDCIRATKPLQNILYIYKTRKSHCSAMIPKPQHQHRSTARHANSSPLEILLIIPSTANTHTHTEPYSAETYRCNLPQHFEAQKVRKNAEGPLIPRTVGRGDRSSMYTAHKLQLRESRAFSRAASVALSLFFPSYSRRRSRELIFAIHHARWAGVSLALADARVRGWEWGCWKVRWI